MSQPWIVLAAMIALGALYVLLPVVLGAFASYRGARRLRCPETDQNAEVGVDAVRAAWTSAFGSPRLTVKACSLWPKRSGCGRACLVREAVEARGAGA